MTDLVTLTQPTFALKPGAVFTMEGERALVERHLPDGKWQFLMIEDREPRFRTDAQLADLMKRGDFFLDHEPGLRVVDVPPISPLLVGPDAQKNNARKHDYVRACLAAPGGFARSRPRLRPIIQAVADSRNETPPGFSTVLGWIDEHKRYGEIWGTAAYSDRHDLKGPRGHQLLPQQERAIEAGIERWLKVRKKGLAYAFVCEQVRAYDEENGAFIDKDALGPEFVDADGRLRPPSLRTFERRCAEVDRFTRDWALKGPAYAKRKNRTRETRALPDRPYAEVEVDHTRLDFMVIDDLTGALLGRPEITVFRDRATAMILGYGLGFEEPSYAAFVEGLRHAIYPKDLSRFPGIRNSWPCHGRIENLIVDNALHFLGDNIEAAGRELGFTVLRCQPRQPWLKGGLERFFGSLNTGLAHLLPGTTLSNVASRSDHEHLGKATLTLLEFEALLNVWICDDYHASVRKGLGFIRGFGDVPLKVWEDKAKKFRPAPLPHPDLFMSLAGDVDTRTIQNDGICWDHIKYESPALWALRSHPRHRRPKEGGSTEYKVVRDPYDLGRITVLDPFEGERLIVPATEAHRDYATGLTLHQHQVITAQAREKRGERVDFQALVEVRAWLAEVAYSISQQPSRKQIERRLSRYLNTEMTRRRISNIQAAPVEGSPVGFDDVMPPAAMVADIGRETWADTVAAEPSMSLTSSRREDDLDDIRARKNWDEFDG